jgi:hypothetical protein
MSYGGALAARGRAGVHLGQDFGQLHAARAESLAVQQHRGHGHDLARFDFLLEQAAIDGRVADARVDHRHQVQRLHHVRAVVAAQAHPGLELEFAFECADLFEQLRLHLRRVAAGLQQRQHQRAEFVAHRHGGKVQPHVLAGAGDLERGPASSVAVEAYVQQFTQRRDVFEQLAHLDRGRAVVQARHQLDRLLQTLQIALQLGQDGGVEHGFLLQGARDVRPGRRRP